MSYIKKGVRYLFELDLNVGWFSMIGCVHPTFFSWFT